MAEFKLTIADTKIGKCIQKDVKEPEANALIGKEIGEAIKGDLIGLAGYEFVITGGSDYCGFPMRKDIPGIGRKKILAVSGTGVRKKAKGIKQRKTVCGNKIHANIVQVNLKITAYGKTPLIEEKPKEGKAGEEPKKEKAEKKPKEKPAEKEEKKEAPKKAEEKKAAEE